MSLWADYVNECGLLVIFEKPWGFVTYSLDEDAVIIHDMFVRKSSRRSRKAGKLLTPVEAYAKEFGLTKLKAAVHSESELAEVSVAAAKAHGFVVQKHVGPYIIIEKNLEVK